MRLLFAVPLTIVLAALSSVASAYVGINLYYVLVGITALWAAFDSRRLGVERYQTRLALEPVAMFFLMALLWPIVFPWYLHLRHLIQTGQAVLGPSSHRNPRGALIVAGIVAALWILSIVVGRHMTQDLIPLAQQLSADFGTPVNVSLNNGRDLVITLPSEAARATETRDQLAHRIAVYARTHYARPEVLNSVRVIFSTVRQVGIAEVTTQDADYQWLVKDLTESSPAVQ